MAGIIDGPWNPALDGNGDPYAASVIEFYQSGTSTPLAAYPTATDAAAGTNGFTSKAADSAGRFTPSFGIDTAVYRVVWKVSSGGATIYTYDDVQPQGRDADTLEYDFDTNGRFRVFGADGKVQIETGDPVGDDVGGDARMGGWDSTQGDTLEIDYAAVTVTGDQEVNGDFTVAGKEVGLYRLMGGSVSATATLDIELPAGYEHFLLILANVVPSTDAAILGMRGDWGAGFLAANYTNRNLYNITGSAAAGTASTGFIRLSNPLDSGAVRGNFIVEFDARALRTFVRAGYIADNSGAAGQEFFTGTGLQTNNTALATDIRLLMDSGNLSCTWTLYGRKGAVEGQAS